MHPEVFGISACDLESLQEDQSTQTSSLSIDKILQPPSNSSKPPVSKNISKSDKGSITVFEFCQILQDPESPQDVTIIKETVTEETKPHPSTVDKDNKSSSSEEVTANRYKYCREVIKPYLKNSADCPESEEELLKNALDSISEDFPDYQPCFEVFDAEKDLSEKSTVQSSRISTFSKVDASTSYTPNMEGNKENEDMKCVPTTKSTERVKAPECPTPVEKSKDPVRDCSPKPKCTKKKSIEGIKTCTPKQSTVCSRCDKEPTIGVKCKNPSYYLTERCRDNCSIPNIPPSESEDTFIDNHKKTISIIKVAMEDFVGKVYKSTKDTVTLITTESAKQIDKVKQMKTESCNTNEPKKCSETKGSETLTSFNFFRKVDSTDRQEKGIGGKPELPKISDVIDNIISKVDSTLTMVSDRMSIDNLPESLKPSSFTDTSSPYDKPSTPPREVSNVLIPTPAPVLASNSVFTTIKDKIVSMFRDEEPKAKESPSRSSTVSSASSNSETPKNEEGDEQLIDKVIE